MQRAATIGGSVDWIRKRPIMSYYVLTFLISWGSMVVVGLIYGMPAKSAIFQQDGPILMMPFLLGPFLSGLLLTGITEGRMGYNKLLMRFHPRIGIKWYILAIAFIPALVILLLGVLSLFDADYLPPFFSQENKVETVLIGLAIGFLGGGLFEEIGWTGFVLPRMRTKRSLLASGLVIGYLWAIWHLLPTYWGSGDQNGNLSLALFIPPLVFYLTVLPAYRELMIWLYERTQSMLAVMLAHMSLTASTIFILSPGVVGNRLSLYYLLLAAVLWGPAAWLTTRSGIART